MAQQVGLQIYNASAGSGKTFTLVKAYLKAVFQSKAFLPQKHLLAITFTNKAVGEMKSRIVNSLRDFSDPNILENPTPLFLALVKELPFSREELHKRSKVLLQRLLHNYAVFDVSTIDKFNQKLIRTFAFDLNIPLNFEVLLDPEDLILKAVNKLISKAGESSYLTKTLVDYAVEKANEDLSWDISMDLAKAATLLIKETQSTFVNKLGDLSLKDYAHLKEVIYTEIRFTEDNLLHKAQDFLGFIDQHNLSHDHFSASRLPKFLLKIKDRNWEHNFDSKWQQEIHLKPLYSKKVAAPIKTLMDSLQPQIVLRFESLKKDICRRGYLKAIAKNITPLSLLGLINKELQTLKAEQNLLFVGEFNAIISKEIKDQPAPFIYERIGEKFNYYFIDEFQDTSELQWDNLIPLIDNTLSMVGGKTLIVGDAKQAIYRWRGGEAEQFMKLANKQHPFHAAASVSTLPTNYRSAQTIVEFNNNLFKHIASIAFSEASHQALYQNSTQEYHSRLAGYVSLSFVEEEQQDEQQQQVLEQILQIVKSYEGSNLNRLSDICVLTRTRKEGVLVADYLSAHGLAVISNETLLINHSEKIRFIIDFLTIITTPKDEGARFRVLIYIARIKLSPLELHQLFKDAVKLPISSFFKYIGLHFGYSFQETELQHMSLYEQVEYIISIFKLTKNTDAYVQFFLDFVFEQSQQGIQDAARFLEQYFLKKDKLSIAIPDGVNAVKIMTIHKAKGLEFPVVIYPFADVNIYKEINPKEWVPNSDIDSRFSHFLVDYNTKFASYSKQAKQIYDSHQSKLELDSINLLYVALTRAVEHMYIITNLKLNKAGQENTKFFSGLFINFLKAINLWNNEQICYEFGNLDLRVKTSRQKSQTIIPPQFFHTPKASQKVSIITKSGYLWDTKEKKAMERGNLLHLMMSEVLFKNDVVGVCAKHLKQGTISEEQAKLLKTQLLGIVEHSSLSVFFDQNQMSYTEKPILTSEGAILVPDRITFFNATEIGVLDYKTGVPRQGHINQIKGYSAELSNLGFKIKTIMLVYVNDEIRVQAL